MYLAKYFYFHIRAYLNNERMKISILLPEQHFLFSHKSVSYLRMQFTFDGWNYD